LAARNANGDGQDARAPGGYRMRPIAELCSGEQAHLLVRGLALTHLDARLRQRADAQQFLCGDFEVALAARGVEVVVA